MPICETCGNDYDKAFQVTMNGSTHTFDSFECAIQALAPTCPNCGTHVVGHGVEKDDTIFCCVHCAKRKVLPSCAIVPYRYSRRFVALLVLPRRCVRCSPLSPAHRARLDMTLVRRGNDELMSLYPQKRTSVAQLALSGMGPRAISCVRSG